jgi:histidine ammonia-lyase
MAVPQPEAAARVQDRYSIRCAPHVIGMLRDALTWLRRAAVASVADLIDRQMALLVEAKFNHGLPQNLSGAPAPPGRANSWNRFQRISSS